MTDAGAALVHLLLSLLGAVGGAAIALRLLRALRNAATAAIRAAALRQLAEVSARTGDLTTLAERADSEAVSRRASRAARLRAAAWLAAAATPLLLPYGIEVLAPAALLWLPLLKRRGSTAPRRDGE